MDRDHFAAKLLRGEAIVGRLVVGKVVRVSP
jgi:hypothetical protein